jgi:uridine kinase
MKKQFTRSKIEIQNVNDEVIKNPVEFIKECESRYQSQIADVIDDVLSLKDIKIILLAGPSSAGKTTSANLMRDELLKRDIGAAVISMDNFFINRDVTPMLEDGSYDFENVTTVDIPYFKQFIDDILETRTAKMPIFDFITGMREKEYLDVFLEDNSVIIIEGIHALNPIILNNHENQVYKVFVNPNAEYYNADEKIVHVRELRRIRRMIRDFYNRGIKPHETLKNWKHVVAGEKSFIFPFKEKANYILDSTHAYELPMYKKYLPALLDGSKEAEEIAEDLSYFSPLSATFVPEDSLLREFLNGVIKQIGKNEIIG